MDLKLRRSALAEEIKAAITKFEKETSLTVTTIEIGRMNKPPFSSVIEYVIISAELE